MSKKNNKKAFKLIYGILMILFSAVFIFSAVYLIMYFWESKKSEDTVDDLETLIIEESVEEDPYEVYENPSANKEENKEPEIKYVECNGVMVQEKYVRLYEKNNDFVGWIKIKDTDINYPVVQSMYEEEYYIYRDFEKEPSDAGTLFIDTSSDVKAPSDNILIYGHNMHTGKMFHDLLEYESEEFYNDHKYIEFDTIHGNNTYKVIAAYRTKIYDKDYTGFKYYQFFDASSEEEFMNYVKNSNAMTGYSIPMDVEYGDSLITLSTCAYHETNGRFVVVAVRVGD